MDMKYFGKLLKLFDYKNKSIFDSKIILKLVEKFKNLLVTYKSETCPTFIEDISYFIYIIDFQKEYDMKQFLQEIIEKYIPSLQTKKDIYIHLASNYKDITLKVIDVIIDFFTSNKELLNADNILFLLGKINSQKNIESLLNKIESLVVKEEELFNEENEIDSFKLLESLEKGGFLIKFRDLHKTKYLMNIFKLQKNIVEKIKKDEINYDKFKDIYFNPSKRKIFNKKVAILFFNYKYDVDNIMNLLEDKFNKFYPNLKQLNDIA